MTRNNWKGGEVMKMERREIDVTLKDIAIKNDDDKRMTVEGYALKWHTESHPIPIGDGDSFVEEFRAGAFDATLHQDDQLVLYGHDINNVLGRTDNRTAQLEADETGLKLSVDLPDTTLGRDVYELVKRGDIAGMSVGFYAEDDEFYYKGDTLKRIINRAKLVEVSLVPLPAYDSSSVSERALKHIENKNNKEEKRQRLTLLTFL